MVKNVGRNGKRFNVNAASPSFVKRLYKAVMAFADSLTIDTFWDRVSRGRWEKHTYEVFDRFVDAEHSYLDAGAWIGPTVLYGSQLARFCYAFEPDPVAFALLESNVRLNPELEKKIRLVNGAIWSDTGKLRFGTATTFGDQMSSGLLAETSQTVSVSSVSIEQFVAREKINDLNFIKMDIEGGEAVVLPALKEFLASRRPTLFVSLHPHLFPKFKEDAKRIVDALGVYRNLYTTSGSPLTAERILRRLNTRFVLELIATDRTWEKA